MECTKVKFSNEKFAVDYIEKLAKTSIRDTKPLRAYLCPYCSTWHLTSRINHELKQENEYKSKISALEELLVKSKKETETQRIRYKNLIKMINGVVTVSNDQLGEDLPKSKHRKQILIGANLMRELLKQCINNLKQ